MKCESMTRENSTTRHIMGVIAALLLVTAALLAAEALRVGAAAYVKMWSPRPRPKRNCRVLRATVDATSTPAAFVDAASTVRALKADGPLLQQHVRIIPTPAPGRRSSIELLRSTRMMGFQRLMRIFAQQASFPEQPRSPLRHEQFTLCRSERATRY